MSVFSASKFPQNFSDHNGVLEVPVIEVHIGQEIFDRK
jgi:hypothetical protein